MAKDGDIIRWITWGGKRIPIKKGEENKFKKKIEEEKNKKKSDKSEEETKKKPKETEENDKKENKDEVKKETKEKEPQEKKSTKEEPKLSNKEEKKEMSDEERKNKIEELEKKKQETQGFIQKGEIQEEIDMLKDNFKGTKEEYREYVAKEQEKRLNEYKKEKEQRIKEFKEQNKEDDDYRMAHRPTETGLTTDNLLKKAKTEDDVELPKDIYEHPEYYSMNNKEILKETMGQLNKVRNNPDAEITIYRATPGDKINNGDWVSLSKKYVEMHNESQLDNKGNILEMKVKAKDVQFAGDTLEEWGYFPKKDREIKNNKIEYGRAYDVGYYTKEEMHNGKSYVHHKTKDGLQIGDGRKEGIEKNATGQVIYNMSDERENNLTPKEKVALRNITNNNKEIENLIQNNTDIYNTKTSRKEWFKKHRGEATNHVHETKTIEEYHKELSAEDKAKIQKNEDKIEKLRQDSIEQAKVLKENEGKYPIKRENVKQLSNKEKFEMMQKAIAKEGKGRNDFYMSLNKDDRDKYYNYLKKGYTKSEIERKLKPKEKSLSDYEQYFLNQGYSKAIALKKAKEMINSRKRK